MMESYYGREILGGVTGGHGFAVSPIVFEDLLIVPNDQEKGGGAHYGLDCKTGEIKWKVPRASKRLTYSTPCIFTSPQENLNSSSQIGGSGSPA